MAKNKLKVVFENVGARSVDFSIQYGAFSLADSCSYITPVFTDFCETLCAAAEGLETKPVTVSIEPIEFDFHFQPGENANRIKFEIQEWPDNVRSTLSRPTVL